MLCMENLLRLLRIATCMVCTLPSSYVAISLHDGVPIPA